MQLFKVMFRTLFFYFFVTISYRLMGKREVGQLGIIDLIVSILIAELVAISIENINRSIILTIIPIFMLVVIEITLAYISIKSRKFRGLLQGKTAILICDGRINYHEMVKQRYSLDDLLLNLRLNSIKSLEEVEYAFLESNGKLSVFKYDSLLKYKSLPLPVIFDGKIDEGSLKRIDLTKKQIYSLLYENNIDIKEVFYAFYTGKKIYLIEKNDRKTFLNGKYLN